MHGLEIDLDFENMSNSKACVLCLFVFRVLLLLLSVKVLQSSSTSAMEHLKMLCSLFDKPLNGIKTLNVIKTTLWYVVLQDSTGYTATTRVGRLYSLHCHEGHVCRLWRRPQKVPFRSQSVSACLSLSLSHTCCYKSFH